jgi:muramoyltetrapeptide carboxypeptidase
MSLKDSPLIQEGDLVALLGPASPLDNTKQVDEAVKAIEAIGLKVKEYPSARARFDYLAGTDKQRSSDIRRAFADKKVKAIVCIRGGYGSSRLLSMIDWKEVAKTPKIFWGFSDITSIFGALNSKSRMVGLHAPMASYFLVKDKTNEKVRQALRQFLFEGYHGISYRELCGRDFKPKVIRRGKASGTLVGGNISLFSGLLGTPWMPKPKEGILFLEEIHEKPYKIDRYITQLINSGYFDRISGIVVGQLNDCKASPPDKDDAMTVLTRCLKPLGIPILAGLPVGHDRPSYPLPIGIEVELDAVKGDLKII